MEDVIEGVTKKFKLDGMEFYVTANAHDDGNLKEIFVHGAGTEGSFTRAMFDAFAILFSLALQSGADFPTLVRKFHDMKFDPQGFTGDQEIPQARSILDYIVKWLVLRFGDDDLRKEIL